MPCTPRFFSTACRAARSQIAALVCLATLGGCHLGAPVSLFDDDSAIREAVGAILRDMNDRNCGGQIRALSVAIVPDQLAIRAQDPRDRRHIDEWRLTRMHAVIWNWERVSAPQAFEPNLINPDIEANLFDLDEIDFSAAAKLIRAAYERAALEDHAQIARMEIARQVSLLPSPASGDVRWTVDVRSEREVALIYGDAHGVIVGADLSATNRVRRLDLYQRPELMVDAARAIRAAVGAGPALIKVTVAAASIGFETTLPDDLFPVRFSGSLSARASFKWSLSGLQRTIGSVNTDAAMGTVSQAPFSVDEVDWTLLPKIVAQARDSLGMPQGRTTDIELNKPTDRAGDPLIVWKIEVTDTNGEKGVIVADTAGAVKQTLLPKSRRPQLDWFDPATIADALARIGQEFANGKFGVILITTRDVTVTVEDARAPGGVAQIILDEEGFHRYGTVGVWGSMKPFFPAAELAALTRQRLADLETDTLAKLGMERNQLRTISISHNNIDLSKKGNVTIEIRAETPGGRGGWVVYELDGAIVRVMRP